MTTDDLPSIPLGSVTPGTRLAAAVLNADGSVLMTAGSLLTESTLERLAARGIVAVAVEPVRSEADLNAAREVLRQRLCYLFRHCPLDDADGAARMLFDAVLERRLDDMR